jgi:FkbM family methyltransferase
VLTGFCNRSKEVVDIGSSGGLYSFRLAPFSLKVHAFEPIKFKINEAKRLSEKWIRNIDFYEVALSNHNGCEDFDINILDSGISKFHRLQGPQKDFTCTKKVNVRTLDSYNLRNVSIIKIDTEGSEVEVLEGAITTIKANMPVLLIESEVRHNHNSLDLIRNILEPLNYQGHFFINATKVPIQEFNVNIHQKLSNAPTYENGWRREEMYINNFLFIPKTY